jgi:hypothetical protein
MPARSRADASGPQGLLLSLPDIETGRRVWQRVSFDHDSALLFAGALTAATYFGLDRCPEEVEIRAWSTRCIAAPTGTGL